MLDLTSWSLNFLSYLWCLWCPTLKEKGALKICRCSWLKGTTGVRGSANNHKVILINCTLGMKSGMSVLGLLKAHGSAFSIKG